MCLNAKNLHTKFRPRKGYRGYFFSHSKSSARAFCPMNNGNLATTGAIVYKDTLNNTAIISPNRFFH